MKEIYTHVEAKAQFEFMQFDKPVNFYLSLISTAEEQVVKGYLLEWQIASQDTYPPLDAVRNIPFEVPSEFINYWNGTEWEVHVNHVQAIDVKGRIVEATGTPYWLPGDDYQSLARYITKPGLLPKEALLEKPLATFTEVKKNLLDDLRKDTETILESCILSYELKSKDIVLLVQADQNSYRRLSNKATMMEAQEIQVTTFIDAANSTHEITLAELKDILSKIVLFESNLMEKKWYLRELIDTYEETDPNWREQLNGIKWTETLELL